MLSLRVIFFLLYFGLDIIFKTQQHKFVNWQCDMEYRGSDFTTAVTLGNPDVLLGSGLFNFEVQRRHLTHLFVCRWTMQKLQKDL